LLALIVGSAVSSNGQAQAIMATQPTASHSQAIPANPPATLDAYAHLVPGGVVTATVGTSLTLDLYINSGSNIVTGQQSYLTFTNSLLQVVNSNQPGCVLTNTVTPDYTTFEAGLANRADNGTGEITYASGTFGSGAVGDFRVARITFCATAAGDAIIHWQFSSPRNSEIIDNNSAVVSNPALYQDVIVHIISAATSTPTRTNTPTITNTPTRTNTPHPTNTPANIPTRTNTPMRTNTPHPTNTPANTPTRTNTPAPTNTPGGPTNTPVVPTLTPTDCPNPFVDINNNVFYFAIHYLNCRSVINGTDATHYSPGGTSTRAQFAKVVVLGFGTPFYTPSSGQSFTDVPPSYFAYVYIETGFHAGILSGFDAPSCIAHGATYPCYLPNLAITRGQLTKLVVNAGGYQPYTPTGGGQDFSDVPPSYVFYVSIETAYHNSIINGYPDGTFRPNNNTRRDEMAQIVYEGIVHRP